MAMGASAQAGPFRPCSSSYPSLPSSSLRRSFSGPAWLARGPFPSLDRRALCSLQRLDAHCSDHTSYGSSRSIEPAVFTTRPVVTSHGMQTIDNAACNRRQPSKFVPAPNLVNMSRAGEDSKRSFRPSLHGGIDGANAAVSGWRMEINKLKNSITAQQNKLKFSVKAQQVREDIANGRISLQLSEHGPVMKVKMADFEVTRDGNTYEVGDLPQLSSFPNESGVNGGRQPQLARNGHTSFRAAGNLAVDIHRQFESSLMQTVNEDIGLDLYQTGEVNTNSSIGGDFIKTSVKQRVATQEPRVHMDGHKEKLVRIYDKVLVVDNIETARAVVKMLTTKYKNFIHACDTEVANIDVKQETPVGHGEIICFSVYSGSEADFGNGKSCIWVDVLDGGRDVLMEFAPFFEDPSIKKVWHNYSFDSHIIENYGIKLSGFHADTMHLARLWDSSRRTVGGYSLEALTSDPKVIGSANKSHSRVLSGNESWLVDQLVAGKISMKSIFGKKKVKKDGSEGKLITIAPVEMLQRGEERIPWICYSAFDSVSTLKLFNSLKEKLMSREWTFENVTRGSMYDFYEEYWRPFGSLLVKMESEGMLVDRDYLSEVEKVAVAEQQLAAERFRKWASKHCPDAKYMNVGSDTQLRLLFFGGIQNRRNVDEIMPDSKTFKVPNTENVIEEGKKTPSKYRTITLNKLGRNMQTEMYTPSGWPSVSGDALKTLAGKIPTDKIYLMDDEYGLDSDNNHETSDASSDDIDTSSYGTAYSAFGPGKEGKEACYAIAALCEVCSIDSLISNFILPLQGGHISGKNGHIHCSLNINTETGRLSARRPNLQNQPALEKDRYKIRQAFIARPGNSLIVADYGQLELRILAHLANCKSMLDAFKAGGDFHSRTAMNMYDHVREAVNEKRVLLEWYPQPGEDKPPVPLLKDAFAAERRKAKMLNFSIAYGKTPVGLSRDWKVSLKEAKKTVELWYKERQEVLGWQEKRKKEAVEEQCVKTLLGRARQFPSVSSVSNAQKGHIERAAINTPVQGSAADVAMCAMLEIDKNVPLRELGWKLLLQVHDEVILEGPTESAEMAKAIVVECMSKPFNGTNILKVDLSVDAKCALNWYAAK